MSHSIPTNRSGVLARVAGVSLLSLLAAACAADSQRFAGIGTSDNMTTGSLPPADVPGGGSYGGGSYGGGSYGGSAAVSAAPLAPPAGSAPAYGQHGANSGFQGVRPDAVTGSATGWTAAGGATVSVGPGDTVQSIADRYGVPPAAIRSANNISGNGLSSGSQVVIPVYSSGGSAMAQGGASHATTHAASRVTGQVTAAGRSVAEAPGRATRQIQQEAQSSAASAERAAKVIAASRAVTQQPAKTGQPPQTLQQQAATVARQAPQAKAAAPAATAPVPAQAPAAQPPRAAQQQVAVAAPQAPEPATAKEQSSGGSFRWPARGRIIAGFNGRNGNEGINIAVPEGTPVKAAEGGVVAYAGSELKGYGNLVLIRHENGWVSAYANNGELMVKRGEKVARGQTVAKSGQSGNVSTPQLHFELRKGSTPVDPLPHLAGG